MTIQKWSSIFLGSAILAFIQGCNATGASTERICADLNATIDRNIFELAMSSEDGSASDRSAVQQGARFTSDSNRWLLIMANLQLMQNNKCTPRSDSIDPSIYRRQAAECSEARFKERIERYSDDKTKSDSKEIVSQKCDLSKWRMDQKK